jgi:uncharacterized phage-like protein YoqJ
VSKVVVVTGYKSFELGIYNQSHQAIPYIKKAIQRELQAFLDDGLEWVMISGTIGVELWAAEVVFDLQLDYPHLKLAVITPFLNQERFWNEQNREYYEMILSQADYVESLSKEEYQSPKQFFNRNVFFLKKSDGAIIVYDEEREGSPKYFYDLAKKYQHTHPYDLRFVTMYDLQSIVEEEIRIE